MMDSKTEFQKEEKDKNLLTDLPLKDESVNKTKKKRKNRKSKAVEILELKNEGKEENLQTGSLLETEINQEKRKITDESDEFQREIMEENLQPRSESNKKRRKRKSRKRKSASVLMKVTNENEHDSSDPVSATNTGQVNPGSYNKNKQNNKKSVVTDEDPVALTHAKISSKDPATSKHYDLSSDDLATFEVIYGDEVSSEYDVDLATFEVINRPSDEDVTSEHDDLISTVASDQVGEHPVASELVGEHPAASEHDTFSCEGSVTNEDAEPYTESPISSDHSELTNESLEAFESEELTCTAQENVHPRVTNEDFETFEHDDPSFVDPALPDSIETFAEGPPTSELQELTEGDSPAIENERNELTIEGSFILEFHEQSDCKLNEERTVGNIGHTTDSNILVSDERSHLEDHLSFPSYTATTNIENQNRKSSSGEVIQPTIADILVPDEMPSTTLKDEDHPSSPSYTVASIIQPTPDIIVSNEMLSFTLRDQDHLGSSSCAATDSKMQCSRSSDEEVPQTTAVILSNDSSSTTLTNEDNPSSPSYTAANITQPTTPDIIVSNEMLSFTLREKDHLGSSSCAATDSEMLCSRSSDEEVPQTTAVILSNDSSSTTLTNEDNPSSPSYTAANITQPTTPDIIVSNEMLSFTLREKDHLGSSSCAATDSEMLCSRSSDEEVPQTTAVILSNDSSSTTLTNEDNPSSPSYTAANITQPTTPDIIVSNEMLSFTLRDQDHLGSSSCAATDSEMQCSRSSGEEVPQTTPVILSNDSSSITLTNEDNPSSSSHTAADIKPQCSGPSSNEKVMPEPLGLFSMLVAVLVFCLIVFCHAFCASFLIFKKPSPQKRANKQKINSDEAHN
ncbi:uncharacterized protein [Parasteatoda tepidariorum]|uniref:uncharacterized protein n=1 Tax=Parasteatoda tepidariorum TaxID=114398 RepID=UPI001C71E3F9|nr:uncharacterized protein LOC107456104 [Parasteatoda tepidariorum]